MRPGLRSGAAPPAGRVQAAGDAGASSGERPGGGGLGLHGRDPGVVRPGPGGRRGGGELHRGADPGTVRVPCTGR
uniref:Uncharacterized protein n=1 Tax=Arundo donax TaxID=35708 RepID=A0A0A8ZYG0_ARUDO